MKKIVLLSAFLILSAGCGKEERRMVEKMQSYHDAVHGRYELVSAQCLGEAVDLDGDGTASTDLYAEFSSLAETSFSGVDMERDVLRSVVSSEFGSVPGTSQLPPHMMRKGKITLFLPFQGISEWTINGEPRYNFHMYFYSYTMYYEVSDDGAYAVEPFSPDWENRDNLDLRHVNDGVVTVTGPGRIQLDLDCMFYDRSAEKIVTAPVCFSFVRYTMRDN